MNGSASESPGPLPERDDQKTVIEYGKGGVPLYIVVSWVVFIATYVLVMAMVALPDLMAWMRR